MKPDIQYTIQIGTDFDGGQELVWTLIREDVSRKNLFVPRPRTYRRQLEELSNNFNGTPVDEETLRKLFDSNQFDPEEPAFCFFSIKDKMQSSENFCPGGIWFSGIGERAAHYRKLLAPYPLRWMISLRNPAMILSDAWASGNYPEFKATPPNPFRLRWASVLRDLRTHSPDVEIVAWCAEEAPVTWNRVLSAATHSMFQPSISAETHMAAYLMTAEGSERLASFLEQRETMPWNKRAQAIKIFLDKFAKDKNLRANMAIPDWSEQKQDQMERHYKADLAEVAQMDGVEFIAPET
ncbi:hypothetical protein Z945_3117 [Sulfitobacter noctilucae]|uniref:hypothetical protein n=1 Tax=Sulfitobacter noctilucae TaxID=1342302 RepID=UPI00046975CF|nr:hypothetical protein [Sulfitobacter noctilucae]KIN70653.1 hypothetical protein Z945_3117 [Sulfitobacter noctilucae]